MSSIFGKDPANQPVPDAFARERIEQEIAHLKNPQSTRSGKEDRKTLGIAVSCLILAAFVGLYVMDPFFFSWYKGDAVRAYLYLHNYDTGPKAQALAGCGIFTSTDIEVLNRRNGSFQDYYATIQDADKNADTVINFMNGLAKVRNGPYADLDTLGKIRYTLFCRWGLKPPTQWGFLNPEIKDQ